MVEDIQGASVRCDPGDPAYEAARAMLAAELRRIGEDEPKSGYPEMADDLMEGDLMQVPTWVALQLIARSSGIAQGDTP